MIVRVNIQLQAFRVCWLFMRILPYNMPCNFSAEFPTKILGFFNSILKQV